MTTKNENNDRGNIKGNPYKGLLFYTEGDQEKFKGRDVETEDLFRSIDANSVTLVHGKSGIGKTSLLKAGVFPKLRKRSFFPIWLRLDYSDLSTSLLEQVRFHIQAELVKFSIETRNPKEKNTPEPPLKEGETWFEYFHRVLHYDTLNKQIVIPVLVFDQFEEFFTLGKAFGEKEKQELNNNFYWLLNEQPPDRTDENSIDEARMISYSNSKADVKVVINLREDYLPHLTKLKERIPSIDRTKFRLEALDGSQARKIINETPGGIKNEVLEAEIMRCFSPEGLKNDKTTPLPDDQLEIEPAFLSLLCQQLFDKQLHLKPLTKDFLDKIFEEFYDSVMNPFSEQMKQFVESKLLTASGYRTPRFLEPNHKLRKEIDQLVNFRVLRKFHDGKREYVEIIHDVLAGIVEERRSLRYKKSQKRKTFILSIALIFVTALCVYAFFQTYRANEQYQKVLVLNTTLEASQEFPEDNTIAIRIAEVAFKMGLPNPPARTYRTLSTIGYSSLKNPFYITTFQHNSRIYTSQFSPDNHFILTASEDGTAKVWNLNGEQKLNIGENKARIISAVFSPDGKRILTASWDGCARVYDLDGNEILELRKHAGPVMAARFSHDGAMIVTASKDTSAILWDLQGSIKAIMDKHTLTVDSVLFSYNNRYILTKSWDRTAKLWDCKGTLLADLEHKGAVTSAIFSPHDDLILTTSSDHTSKLWNLKGELVRELLHEGAVSGAFFSPKGTMVLTTETDGTVQLWDLEKKSETKLNHQGRIQTASFNAEGDRILTVSQNGETKIWTLDGNLYSDLNIRMEEISSVAFSPDCSMLVTASQKGLAKIWDLKSNIIVDFPHSDKVETAEFSPDGGKILTADGSGNPKLWDDTGNLLVELPNQRGEICTARFSTDGRQIFVASERWDTISESDDLGDRRSKISIWDLKGYHILDLEIEGRVLDARMESDNSRIITANSEYTAKLWNFEENCLAVLEGHTGMVMNADFSDDGSRLLTTSEDKTVKLWDSNGQFMRNICDQKTLVASVAFTSDGKRILIGLYNGTVQIFDLQGTLLTSIDSHSGMLNSVRFSTDGKRILVGCEDHTAKLFSLKGELLADLDFHDDVVNSVAFSSNGKKILTASSDHSAKVCLTPEAIIEYLKTSKINRLSNEDRGKIGHPNS